MAFASTVSFASIVITFLVWFPKEDRPLGALVFLPVVLPYAFIPLRLYSRRLRSGLSLAMTMGGAMVIPGIYLLGHAIIWDNRWWVISNLILALMMQLLLFIVALKAYMVLPRLPGASLGLLANSAYGFLLFAVFLVYSPVPRYIAERKYPSGLIAVGFILLSVLATYLIFRKTSFLLYMGLSLVLFAFKPLFTKVFGHRIYAYWHEPIELVVVVLVLIGIVWALINAAMDRQRKVNLLGLIPIGCVMFWTFLLVASAGRH